jgi:hypothetical protein
VLRIAAIAAAAAVAGAPSPALFKDGYDLCKAAPLSAVRAAGAQPYKRGLFANKSCTWVRPDLKAGVTLSTHPPAAGAMLMEQFLQMNGKSGFVARRVHVPGASRAVLVTMPRSLSTTPAKDLFAAYPRGVVQVNMTAPGTLPARRLLAVLHAVT